MVRHFTFCGIAAGALLLMAGAPALAQTTTLVCHLAVSGLAEDEPTTIELNETQHSVKINVGAYHYTLGPGGAQPASSYGPVPAVFGADTITFSDARGTNSINRLTGDYVNPNNWHWACEAGQKKF